MSAAVTLTTSRLILEPISSLYREEIFRDFTRELTVFMTPKITDDISGTDTFIASSLEKMGRGEEIECVILNKETKEFLGAGGVHHINTRTPELGIWIKKGAQGHGYGLEAVRAMKEWTDAHVDYEYIKYKVAVDNIPSRKIVEALGGRVIREFREPNNAGVDMAWVECRIYKPGFSE